MACDICLRDAHTKDLSFLCATDARNLLYAPRLTLAQLYLENDSLQSQIASSPNPNSTASQQTSLDDSTTRILAAAANLRTEIATARQEIRERRAELERRRDRLHEVKEKVEGKGRREKEKEEVEKKTRVRRLQWAQKAEEMAGHRAFLCHEAARLYGVRKGKSSGGKGVYYLARLPVVELTNMNSLSPEVISTSLAHICHILMIASHYLSIRLPAEVIMPHRDHPRPAIYNLSSSYASRPSAKSRASSNTRSASTVSLPGSAGEASRPRPLYIDKPLTQLAKEDSAAYAFFLEGVTLLAYDVAWLCCTQGVSIGEKSSFEDVCQMGKNLYNLLIARQTLPSPPPTVPATNTDQAAAQRQHSAANENGSNTIGRYSHGSTYYSLLSAEGTELVRGFRLPSPMKLVDKLKRKLMGDAPDWEVVDDDAWKLDDGDGIGAPTEQAQQQPDPGKGSPRGEYQGWMRVKSR